jgi:hypothetical protein
MSEQTSALRFRDLPVALAKKRWMQALAALLLVLELYNQGVIPLYVNYQKSVEAAAIARNASLRQKAEAENAEWKAITETEIAAYAARKQRADATKTTADARKAEAEAVIARETRRNAEIKAKGEAEASEGEAAIKQQQIVIERERSMQAQRLYAAQALASRYEEANAKVRTMSVAHVQAIQQSNDLLGMGLEAINEPNRCR